MGYIHRTNAAEAHHDFKSIDNQEENHRESRPPQSQGQLGGDHEKGAGEKTARGRISGSAETARFGDSEGEEERVLSYARPGRCVARLLAESAWNARDLAALCAALLPAAMAGCVFMRAAVHLDTRPMVRQVQHA